MHGVRLLYTSLSLALLVTAACGSDDDKPDAQATPNEAGVPATAATSSAAPA